MMGTPYLVAAPPEKPLLVFDGECGFCRWWIGRWRSLTGDRIDYAPSQQVAARFPEIPAEAFARSVQLILPSGEVFEGAHAVFRSLAFAPDGHKKLLWLYGNLPGFAAVSEAGYRFIACHRTAALAVTRALWGNRQEKPTYEVAAALLPRLLGLCYLAAFLSLWVQVDGLIGSRGILPAARFFQWVGSQVGAERFHLLPTLCWFNASDGFLHLLCGGGVFLSLLLVAGVAPSLCLALLWVFYLSLSVAAQTFLEFQWDILLLEAGFLSIFLAPLWWRPRLTDPSPSRTMLFLLRWLLFRLIFSSGVVKLSSGDLAWRHLTALRYHYETQPLPPPTAWFAHHFTPSFQTASVLFVFAVEIFVPFLIFAPRRLRLFAFWALVALQVLIAATGNYAFFNLLAIVLCVTLLDDSVFPRKWLATEEDKLVRRWPAWVIGTVAAVTLLATSVHLAGAIKPSLRPPGVLTRLASWLAPFRSTNGYGLFMMMTTSRPEIVVEGSEDGESWRAYEFRWKPGDVRRSPRFVAPHQPRLDWQMWFAALGTCEENPWFVNFLARLLEGSPPVLRLLASNPFPGHPPRYVRAVLYDYHFTDAATRRATGAWWQREEKGLYCPVLSKEMLGR